MFSSDDSFFPGRPPSTSLPAPRPWTIPWGRGCRHGTREHIYSFFQVSSKSRKSCAARRAVTGLCFSGVAVRPHLTSSKQMLEALDFSPFEMGSLNVSTRIPAHLVQMPQNTRLLRQEVLHFEHGKPGASTELQEPPKRSPKSKHPTRELP